MKKYSLILLLIFQVWSLKSQTNVYHSFPTDSAVWNVSNQHFWDLNCFDYSYFFNGDTIINNKTYSKLRKQGVENLMLTSPFDYTYKYCSNQIINTYNIYCGAIREDLSQKKVYICLPSYSVDSLLYDFTLNVGDTIKGYFSSSSPITISSIDSILIGNNYRKRWNIIGGWTPGPSRIVEGIGCVYGLLELPYVIEKNIRNLDCFSEKNQIVYPNYISNNSCQIITSVSEIKFDEYSITISPNPSIDIFKLEYIGSEKISIEITDVYGRVVQCIALSNPLLQLDLSNEKNGVYFVQVMDEKGNAVTKKIIKQ